ncbi:MAG: hypothetical protein ACD_11C00012G0004 [uncultured bacterium]|nr:MAG: hypothetical protein ACD_11C00012G0004 [uncultured bacterium]
MKRVPDVLDTWFDSGSMPFAQKHYPFENADDFEKSFPAQFIAEGQDQTRTWFYYLHVISTAIKDSNSFENVIVNGTVLAEDGKKMSKRLKNYPDPQFIIDKYGADSLRFYLMSSPVVAAQNLNFSEKEVAEVMRGMLRMLWNSYSFFTLYANIDGWKASDKQPATNDRKNLLDRWIISELASLSNEINSAMESYDLVRAARLFPKFVDNLSNWYVRRSRKRFWKSENDEDKNEAYATMHYVLVELSKLMAPFMPFISDEIYKNLTGKESVHLESYPEIDPMLIDGKLNEEMSLVREIITQALQLRAKEKIKVRQPLSMLTINRSVSNDDLLEIIQEEVNVKKVVVDKTISENVLLNTEISDELRLEGQAREIIRHIQEMRKEAGYEVDNRIKIWYNGVLEVFDNFNELIKKETLADGLEQGKNEQADLEKQFEIEGKELIIGIKR